MDWRERVRRERELDENVSYVSSLSAARLLGAAAVAWARGGEGVGTYPLSLPPVPDASPPTDGM